MMSGQMMMSRSVYSDTTCKNTAVDMHADIRPRCGNRRRSWVPTPVLSRQASLPLAKESSESLGFQNAKVRKTNLEVLSDQDCYADVGVDVGLDNVGLLPSIDAEDLNIDNKLEQSIQQTFDMPSLSKFNSSMPVHADASPWSTHSSAAPREMNEGCSPSAEWIDRGGDLLAAHGFKGYLCSPPWKSSIDGIGNFTNIPVRTFKV